MIQIHDHGKVIEVEPSDKSQLTRGIMRSSELLLSFRSDVALDIHVGATVDFEGETFTLYYPSEVKKLWRGYFDYTITLHSSAELLKQRLLKDPSDPGRTAFTFTGSAHDFATLVARSMGEGWSVGDCMVSDGDRMIAFREETCLGALARIAEDFHSEWVVERQTIAIRKQELWRDAPVAMSYGRGKGFLSGVSRSGDGDKLPISRLYVVGGSRNIDPAAYGSRSLHLPDGSTALSSGVEGREAALDLSHIYPSRVGTVSEVVTVSEEKCFYDIKDASIPADLNYSDCRIPGEKAVIRFQSGALAGRELEIRQSETALEGYHHEERRFELVPREEDGFTFPSPQWMPKAGDKYAVFGISLPPTYIKEAEERMLSEAKRYLEDNKEPVYTFRGEVDGIWARKHWLELGGKLVPGGHVLFSDPEFHPSGSVIRIVSTTQAVNDPHAPSITLSTAPVPGSLLSRLDRVEADEVVRREQIREVQRQQSQSYRQALEHLSMVDRAVEGLEGFTRRLKPSVLETMGILVGSQATQLDFVRAVGSLESVTPAINYDPDTKALHIGESVLRHQTIGITTMRDRRDPSEYRYWRLPEYVSPPLTDPDRSYYIYARAARVGSSGSFLLSEKPIPMESEEGWYHLLIGTLSSLDGGDRAYNRLYGFSMISPGQMVVDTISSANGRMSIDLARGEIYASSVSFSRPDGARGSLSDLAGEVDQLQSHPPKIVDGKWHVWDGKAQTYVNTGDDARGETGKNGLSPKIVDGKWSVWDGSRWVSTGVPAQGPKGEQGAPGKDVDPKVLNDLKTAVDDAKSKLADTVTKAELDGVVSAQEKHDIQAAKAALDAAKKAYDDAVKRAKELDGEIQVGGRNLAVMSRMIPGYLYGEYKKGNPGDKDYKVMQYKDFVYDPTYYEWDGATPLTYRIKSVPKGRTGMPIIHYHDKDKVFIGWAFDWSYKSPGYTKTLTPKPETAYIRIGFVTPEAVTKIERGTVATDWTPAPEDVQAEIAAAKEQATKAQQSTDNLKGYVDGAFRDGIVDDAEAKAIKTYINEVDAQWQSALGAYEKVYTNSLLTGSPKTALLDCKTTLAGKCDDLTKYIATAIGDGKATAAEVDGVNSRYNAYKTALKDFQRALKDAEEAIRKKSGGAKFLGEATSLGFDGGVQLESGQFVYGKAGDTVRMTNTGSNNVTSWEKDKVYILVLTTDKGYELLVWVSLTGRDGKDGAPGRDGKDGAPGRDGRDGVDGKDGVGADYSKEVKELQDGLASANTSIAALKKAKEEIEKGKLSADDLPAHLKWIYDAFSQGSTEIEGGLILSQVIGLSNSSGKITSYISGRNAKGAHMLAAGVTSLADTDAVSYIDYDGTAKFGNIRINRDSIYIDAGDSGSGLHQVVHDRLYITRSGIFAYLDHYITGGLDTGIFKANYEQGFHSKRVSIGDGGSNYIGGGNLKVDGDLDCRSVSPIKASGRVYIDGQTGRYPQSLTHETVSGKWCSTSQATRISESVVRVPIKSFGTSSYLVFITAFDQRSDAKGWGRVYKIINQTTTYFDVDMRSGAEGTYVPQLSIQYLVIGR